MNKEDNIDAIKFYVKQKQIDEMREYTKDYGRDQFVRALVDQRTEIAYLKQALNEIRKYIIKNSHYNMTDYEYQLLDKRDITNILQITDKAIGDDDNDI